MSKNIGLVDLRIRLDEAITYGGLDLAEKLAEDGLAQAKDKGMLGEIEYFKGQIEILNENYPQAIKHFDRALLHNPKDGAAFNDRALCMIELDVIDGALFYFDKGIEVEPDYATVYHNKGWLLSKMGRFDEAVACFNKAIELEPDRAVTYENLADLSMKLSHYKDALDFYHKALKALKPEYVEIRAQIIEQVKIIEEKITKNNG